MSLENAISSADWVRLSELLAAFGWKHFADEIEEVVIKFRRIKPATLPPALDCRGRQRLAAAESRVRRDYYHSNDWQFVKWNGRDYVFTPQQRKAVRVLWEAWERGEPEVDQQTLLRAAGSEAARLPDLFRDHPNWHELIIKAVRTLYKLAIPVPAEDHGEPDRITREPADY